MRQIEERIRRAKQWWRNAPPRTKRNFILAGLFIIIGVGFVMSSLINAPRKKQKATTPPKVELLAQRTKEAIMESAYMRKFGAKLESIENEVKNLKETVSKNKNIIEEIKRDIKTNEANINQIQVVLEKQKSKISELTSQKTPATKPSTPENPEAPKERKPVNLWDRSPLAVKGKKAGKYKPPIPTTNVGSTEGSLQQIVSKKITPPKRLINEVLENKEPTSKQPETEKSISVIIPSGTHFRGLLLNGVDAPVSMAAKKEPYPVLIKIKTEAWLPNEYRYDVKGCYIIASAWGDMSAERAYFRTERLSCVFKKSGVIETALDGSIIDGQDGKLGVYGRVVTKNSAYIARSLLAGIASGLSKVFTPQANIPVANVSENGKLYSSPPVGLGLQYGLYGGLSKAAENVANYYLKMAEQTFPVIEINAGTPIEVMLVRGLTLTLKGGNQ